MEMDSGNGVYIDGELYTLDQLSYREQRDMRDAVRSIVPGNDLDEAGEMDIIPALVWVVKRRTDPKFTLDQALDIKPVDLQAPVEEAPSGPPRKPRRTSSKAAA